MKNYPAGRMIQSVGKAFLNVNIGLKPQGLGLQNPSRSGEECQAIPQAGELLWGNPAFLLARAMLRIAADESVAEAIFFGDIPAFSFEQDGEPKLQPAVEAVLTEVQANALLAQVILTLMGYQQRRGVRLLGGGG